MPQQPQETTPDTGLHARTTADPATPPAPLAEQVHDDALAALAGEEPPARYEPESGPPVEAGSVTDTRRPAGPEPAVTSPAATSPAATDGAPAEAPGDRVAGHNAPADNAPGENTLGGNVAAGPSRVAETEVSGVARSHREESGPEHPVPEHPVPEHPVPEHPGPDESRAAEPDAAEPDAADPAGDVRAGTDARGAAIQADALAAGRRAAAQAQAIEASRRAAAQANAAQAASAPEDRAGAEAAALHASRRPSGEADTDPLPATAQVRGTATRTSPLPFAGPAAAAQPTAAQPTAALPTSAGLPTSGRPAAAPGAAARVDETGTDLLPGFDQSHVAPARRSRGDNRRAGLRRTRRPIVGLTALVIFGLVAVFFGWVSADPFWLAVGKGTQGTATVTHCDSGSAGQCVGKFTSPRFSADGVALSGVSSAHREAGAAVPARMLANDRDWAYAGPAWALHLRWALGLGVVLLCGVALAVATGARFLRPLGRGAALGGRLLALAGPLLLFAGMLGAALL